MRPPPRSPLFPYTTLFRSEARAAELVQRLGAFRPDQFGNPANLHAHELGTGPEIWEQSGGRVDFWVASVGDRKSTRLNSSHSQISYAVFCLKKKNIQE